MARYERPHSADWVELEGASELSMDQLDRTFTEHRQTAQALVKPLITAASFTRAGQAVDVQAEGLGALTWKQWIWLRDRVFEAVKDELLDPEV